MLLSRSCCPPEEIEEKSEKICERLTSLPEFKNAKNVLIYYPTKNEVRVDGIITEALKEKRVFLPVIDKGEILASEFSKDDKLVSKTFGVMEPENPRILSPEKIDLVIVPGVAFDKTGKRIGYGKGFYDKFLKKIRKGVPVIALAYEFQVINKIPGNHLDMAVDKIITEKEIIECKC